MYISSSGHCLNEYINLVFYYKVIFNLCVIPRLDRGIQKPTLYINPFKVNPLSLSNAYLSYCFSMILDYPDKPGNDN